jgi:Family of unknown function (DUF5755)
MPRQCPPNTFCFSNEFMMVIIGILIIIIAIGFAFRLPMQQQAPIIIKTDSGLPPIATTQVVDSRFTRAPQPLRDWMEPPEYPPRGGIATIPINIPTQGLPESFQMTGNINVDGKMLPLYGRRTMRGSSDRWNYYTRTDTFNPVPIPLRYKNRDCMDDIGCQELYSGEQVSLDGTGENGKVRLFRYDGPKYIPGLI